MVGVEDIERIYRGYVRVNDTPEYLTRYVPLPLERNTARWRWEMIYTMSLTTRSAPGYWPGGRRERPFG